jgi:hypothetical protein
LTPFSSLLLTSQPFVLKWILSNFIGRWCVDKAGLVNLNHSCSAGLHFAVVATSKRKFSERTEKPQETHRSDLEHYEIPFNRHFYTCQPPRPLEEIAADIKILEKEILALLGEVTHD